MWTIEKNEPWQPGIRRIEYRSAADGRRDWALVRPGRTSDWAVVLHGHGSHGDQLYTRADIRDSWLACFDRAGVGVLTPNLRDNGWMGPESVADLHALLGWLRETYAVERTLFTSGSMGGTGNLIYATFFPEEVGAVIARGAATDLVHYHRWLRERGGEVQREIADALVAAYGGTPEEEPERYRRHSALFQTDKLSMPVYLLHGTEDALMPFGDARKLAEKAAGPHFHFTAVEGGDHDSPLNVPAGFDWARWQ